MRRSCWPSRLHVLITAALALLVWSRSCGDPSSAQGIATAGDAAGVQQFREGERVESLRGRFETVQGRLAFITEDGQYRFGALENLSLERVYRLIGDGQQSLRWEVSGVITEYRGANYLLLTRATLLTGYRRDVAQ